MGWLLLWLLCGIVAAVIYQGKGRSAGAAFLVGIVFGPIGVILAALTPADKAAQDRQAVASGTQKKCPKCAELVKAEATVCRFCGHEFAPPAPVPTLPEGQAMKLPQPGGGARCSVCGQAVRAEADLCKHCKRTFVNQA